MFGCEIGCRVLVVEDKGKFVQRERRRLTGGGGIEGSGNEVCLTHLLIDIMRSALRRILNLNQR